MGYSHHYKQSSAMDFLHALLEGRIDEPLVKETLESIKGVSPEIDAAIDRLYEVDL